MKKNNTKNNNNNNNQWKKAYYPQQKVLSILLLDNWQSGAKTRESYIIRVDVTQLKLSLEWKNFNIPILIGYLCIYLSYNKKYFLCLIQLGNNFTKCLMLSFGLR